MLAYYVELHMRQALAPLLFDDEEVEQDRKRRDQVKPARPSASAERKRLSKQSAHGFPRTGVAEPKNCSQYLNTPERLNPLCVNRIRFCG